jgi:YCII-related domain
MSKFVLAYRGGGMPDTAEEQETVMAAWGAWFGALGESVIDGGAPFGASAGVGGEVIAQLTGYSILDAATLDDAVAKANGCPILTSGGTVEVYEALDMG